MDQKRIVVDEGHALRPKVAAHAHGAEAAKRAIRAGVDSIEHGTLLDDEALALMAERGTYLVPTMMPNVIFREWVASGKAAFSASIIEKAKAAGAAADAMVRRAMAKRVRIAFGTDSGVYPHGRNAEEFAELVRLGMRPVDALRAATSVNAELLGLSDRVGLLKAGMIADIVATPGDPTRDVALTQKVFFVMKDGVIHRNDGYGTFLAQVYMRAYPERVRSAVFFGTVSMDPKLPLYHAPTAQRALDLVFFDCQTDAACNAAYPDLRRDWERQCGVCSEARCEKGGSTSLPARMS